MSVFHIILSFSAGALLGAYLAYLIIRNVLAYYILKSSVRLIDWNEASLGYRTVKTLESGEDFRSLKRGDTICFTIPNLES